MRWQPAAIHETIPAVPSRELILLGAGGHASVVAESAVAAGWTIVGYCANEPTREIGCAALRVPYFGPPSAQQTLHRC